MDRENSESCGLAGYVNDTFKQFEEDRKDIEVKWEKNINAFKKRSEGEWKEGEGEDWRSDTFIGITKQKILAAYSIVIDTLLQGGKIPFFLKLSNVSEQELERIPEEERELIDQDIDMMTAKIEEDMAHCEGERQLKKTAMAGAIYGESWGKKSIHSILHKSWVEQEYEDGSVEWEQVQDPRDHPKWEEVTNWDMFRDLEADDVQSGRAIIHRVMMSPYELRQLADEEFTLEDTIENVIKTADSTNGKSHSDKEFATLNPAKRDIVNRHKNIRVLEYWGRIPRSVLAKFSEKVTKDIKNGSEYLQDFNLSSNDEFDYFEEESGHDVECMVLVANDEVVRFVVMDEGERPFYRVVWEEATDHNHGIGIADNIEQIQMVLNGAVRAYEDNKKLSGNVILALKREHLKNQPEKIKPGMTIELEEMCEDARQAIQQIEINDIGESLIGMVNLMLQFADDESNIPRIQQGSTGSGQETAFELSQRLEKSGKYLGAVIRNYDKSIIEPVITDFLEFNMLDPEAPGKGNYVVKANGFTSFQNKVTKLSAINQVMSLVLEQPDKFPKVDMDQLFKDFCELLDIDPDKWMKNEEDLTNEAEAQNQEMEQRQALFEAELEKIKAETILAESRAQAEIADAQIQSEKLKLEMAKEINGSGEKQTA